MLGGSYAIGRYIAGQLGRDIGETGYDFLTSPALREQLGQAVFFTATDGNHGRGVAWAAHELGQRAVVLMPKGTSRARLANIQKLGAEVTVESLNYDDCVRKAARLAAETPNSAMVQDTAWEGYTEIPSAIMQGYATLVDEALSQLRAAGIDRADPRLCSSGGRFARRGGTGHSCQPLSEKSSPFGGNGVYRCRLLLPFCGSGQRANRSRWAATLPR